MVRSKVVKLVVDEWMDGWIYGQMEKPFYRLPAEIKNGNIPIV
jgi:hypothetical protein